MVDTTASEEDETNNSFTATTTMVSGYAFEGSINPGNQTVAIGGTAEFVIDVENTGLLADEYEISVSGLETVSYTLSQNQLGLLPHEKRQVTLTAQYDIEPIRSLPGNESGLDQDLL